MKISVSQLEGEKSSQNSRVSLTDSQLLLLGFIAASGKEGVLPQKLILPRRFVLAKRPLIER